MPDGSRRLTEPPREPLVQVETKNALGFTKAEMDAQKAKGDAASERQRKKIARQAKGMKS
jgi:hypothetical protein